MKKLNTLFTVILLFIAHKGITQVTQQELASGFGKTDFTSFSFRPLTPDADFSIGKLAFFQKYHDQENEMFDESGIQSTFFLKINKAISVGPGLYYNSAAVEKRVNSLNGIMT